MYTGQDIKMLREAWLDLNKNKKIKDFAKIISNKITISTIRNWEKKSKINKPIPKKYHTKVTELMEQVFSENNVNDKNKLTVEKSFIEKIRHNKDFMALEENLLVNSIALWNYVRDPKTPMQSKAICIAALVYLINPIDAIPDFTPLLGYSDDAAIIVGAISQFLQISKDHKQQARDFLKKYL